MHSATHLAYNVAMNLSKKTISAALSVIAAGCLIAAGFLYAKELRETKEAEKVLESLRPFAETSVDAFSEVSVELPEKGGIVESDAPGEEQAAEAEPEIVLVQNPYSEAFLANEDMVAWIVIPDTNIDYPVMWTPRDENYYLLRDFEGKDSSNGSLILDTDSSLSPLTTNLIIHGHNMRSGAMFGHLTDYADKGFCEEHNQIILYTEECQRNYEVIAVFRSQVYKKSDEVFKFYKFFQADTQEEFDDFYQNIKELSIYDTGVTAEFGDRFITLSTCAYHVEQGRFVVVAKEVESGDAYLPVRE